jgi:hypothetical protein
MTKRETTFEPVRNEAGEMVPGLKMERDLENRGEIGEGQTKRVPVILADPAGKWYWCGFRALIPPAFSQVAVKGRRYTVETVEMSVRGMGAVTLAQAVHPQAQVFSRFNAPWPLESVADAERYRNAGVTSGQPENKVCTIVGWSIAGVDAVPALKRAVTAVQYGRPFPEDVASVIRFPSKAETVERQATWGDVARELVANRETMEAFRKEMGETRDKLDAVRREIAAVSRRMESAANKRAVESLAGQVESLAGQVESLAGQVESLAALV